MNRDQFVRALRSYARDHGLAFRFDGRKGKCGHGRVHLGERFTTVPSGEIKTPTLAAILKQLGLTKDDL
jgi:hypothetical protein